MSFLSDAKTRLTHPQSVTSRVKAPCEPQSLWHVEHQPCFKQMNNCDEGCKRFCCNGKEEYSVVIHIQAFAPKDTDTMWCEWIREQARDIKMMGALIYGPSFPKGKFQFYLPIEKATGEYGSRYDFAHLLDHAQIIYTIESPWAVLRKPDFMFSRTNPIKPDKKQAIVAESKTHVDKSFEQNWKPNQKKTLIHMKSNGLYSEDEMIFWRHKAMCMSEDIYKKVYVQPTLTSLVETNRKVCHQQNILLWSIEPTVLPKPSEREEQLMTCLKASVDLIQHHYEYGNKLNVVKKEEIVKVPYSPHATVVPL